MLRYLLNKMLLSMKKRYDYDVRYMQEILTADLLAFIKYMGFQLMASHSSKVPAEALAAARIRAIIWGDCGSCAQLAVNLALEAKVEPGTVRAIVDLDLDALTETTALVTQFTDMCLAHNPEAEEIRKKIRALWGTRGLIAIAFSISSAQVYPALKYTLGYGDACSRIQIDDFLLAPKR